MPHKETYIEGIWYPSVTTITGSQPKPWVEKWKAKWGILAERKTKMASAIGDEFHRCVESYLLTGSYSVQPAMVEERPLFGTNVRIEGMMRSFVKWAESVDGEVITTELQVVNKTYVYSGTLDAIIRFKGKKHVQ